MTRMLEEKIKEMIQKLSLKEVVFSVEPTENPEHGDYATNVALIVAKQVGRGPREVAEELRNSLGEIENVEKIEIAGPGFINFYLKADYFVDNLKSILEVGDEYGKGNPSTSLRARKVMVEYTDPNVMKPFHIGHLMTNAIGEAISRLVEFSGAEVKRANYYSDAGLAIAKAVWGMRDLESEKPEEDADIIVRTDFLGRAYAHGVRQSEERPEVAEEVKAINKQIYDRSDAALVALYDLGKRWSLEHFEILYKKLGSVFDYLIPETSVAPMGLEIVRAHVGSVFEESEGAIVFKGEKYDPTLHTRVFVNKEGLPTYEAKELALNKKKFELFTFDQSLVFTANEQNDYFRVVLRAIALIWPDIASRTKHFGHGLLRLPDGKMSSRKGNAITGESLIADVEDFAKQKMKTSVHLPVGDQSQVATEIAVGAIKFSILRQAVGKDIIFDFEKSLSFEGDSGPYLQYTHARIKSVLEKAGELTPKVSLVKDVGPLEKKLAHFPEMVSRAASEYAPQYIVTYLLELASSFNAYYAQNKIIDLEHEEISEYRLALAQATAQVLRNGLWLLGIKAPEKM